MVRPTLFFLPLLMFAGSASAGEFDIGDRKLVIPDGYTIEKVAGTPLVDRPIVADFDEQGRLYIADSSGSNDPVQEQLKAPTHRVVRLEDTDGDGAYDKSVVFADKMMFPEGALWYEGALYVAAPPSIWKLEDTDDDGVADKRTEWFQGKTLTGCANDLHGPYLGRDGRIYWCKGAFAEQTYERPGRKPLVTRAAHIFRARPDGTEIEPVMTGGMDNPVEVAFEPGGERFFTTTFLQSPGGGKRDGIIHAIYGGVYGKVHGVLDGHPRTRPEVMPVLAHLGPAAPSGLAFAESEMGPDGGPGALYAALFNLHKVTKHALVPKGGTYATEDVDLVRCDHPDFHPTDVLEDADGSLIVIDTGGWYKLCCPSSQLVKSDVFGAVYRLRKAGAARPEDPRGLKLDWEGATEADLATRLSDPRPAVRERALRTLARREPAKAIEGLKAAPPASAAPLHRRNVAWATARIDHPEARALARTLLADEDEAVRRAATHAAGLWRDPAAAPVLAARLAEEGSVAARRALAEALGRIGDRSAVPALLAAVPRSGDTILDHSLIYALIEIGDAQGTALALKGGDPRTRVAALIALDQMGGEGLDPQAVFPLLGSNSPDERTLGAWIVGRHPEWGEALAGRLGEWLDDASLPADRRRGLEQQLANLSGSPAVEALLAARLGGDKAPAVARASALRALARSGRKDVPEAWVAGISRVVAARDAEALPLAVGAARALNVPPDKGQALVDVLTKVGDDEEAEEPTRLQALAAVPGGLPAVAAATFVFLQGRLDPAMPPGTRALAADTLSRAKLTPEQRVALVPTLKAAGPIEANRLIQAFAGIGDADLGRSVVEALRESPARAGLNLEELKKVLANLGPELLADAEEQLAGPDAAQQRAKLDQVLRSLPAGDIRRGQLVFNGTKASCSACHEIGYLGGQVGPDLTKIGTVREERDLLEAILYPSSSFVRSYEPVTVILDDGQVKNGVLRKDDPDEVVLATGINEEARIPRDRIEEMRPGTVSVMPGGLNDQLAPQELADLIAFLRACK
jgi:putative membrane-bound dehydrogenase-like protein